MQDVLCDYGCGELATYELGNGKKCCQKSYNSCPTKREKNSQALKKAHAEGRLSTTQLDGHRGWSKGLNGREDKRINFIHTDEYIFIKNSSVKRSITKRVFLLENEYTCTECGLGNNWNGKEIVLELDHINGVNNDNRKENLRLLCPNCHSQTETFRGKNNKGKNYKKLTDEELIAIIKNNYNIANTLKEANLSGGANYYRIHKLMHLHNIQFQPKPKPLKIITPLKEKKTFVCDDCKTPITGKGKLNLCQLCYRKTKRKIERPTLEVLEKQIKELGYSATGRLYNVSDNAIRKWLKAYN